MWSHIQCHLGLIQVTNLLGVILYTISWCILTPNATLDLSKPLVSHLVLLGLIQASSFTSSATLDLFKPLVQLELSTPLHHLMVYSHIQCHLGLMQTTGPMQSTWNCLTPLHRFPMQTPLLYSHTSHINHD
jgi:hypothetical protein